MKKIAIILMVVIMLLLFSFCSLLKNENTQTECVVSSSSEIVYVDEEEGTMYLYASGVKKAGLSIMLNPDGTPKIFNKDTNTYKNVLSISSEMIYVDEEEGTMYLYVSGLKKAGLSVMLKADGTPKIFNEDTNTYKNIYNASSELVYVDEEEGTMYLFITGIKKAGLSVMLKANGTPKVFNENTSTYKNICKASSELVYVDEEEGTMYLYVSGVKKAGLSVMLKADGTPKIYNKDTSAYKMVYNIFSELIYVDDENGVEYLYATGVEKAGLSVMLYSSGLPKVYDSTK